MTIICVFVFVLIAASFTLGSYQNGIDGKKEDVALRKIRSPDANGQRRRSSGGNTVDNAASTSSGSGRHRGGNRGSGNSTGGRRDGSRGQAGGAGRGGRQQAMFRGREVKMVSQLSAASAQFALKMYNSLRQAHPQLVFSPHSVHTALTMTYMGAKETTATQMLGVLNLQSLRKDKAHQAYAALTRSLTSTGNVTLNIANAVHVKPNFPVENAFRQGLQNLYKASFDHFDYQAAGGPEFPINAWVALKTGNKIRGLLSQGTITPLTALIIINAIYFKGTWKEPFNNATTTEQPFHRAGGSSTPVFLMTRTGNLNYTRSSDLDSHVVELQYQGDRFSMFIILPRTRGELPAVERSLTFEVLDRELRKMRSTRVELFLPRFNVDSKFSLKETLITMGMDIPFDQSRAKFGGISPTHDLYISDAIHQAVVEVNEEGTVAAAATGVIIGLRSSLPSRVTTVRADHPFIFAIRDNLTNTWLFMGKYTAAQ